MMDTLIDWSVEVWAHSPVSGGWGGLGLSSMRTYHSWPSESFKGLIDIDPTPLPSPDTNSSREINKLSPIPFHSTFSPIQGPRSPSNESKLIMPMTGCNIRLCESTQFFIITICSFFTHIYMYFKLVPILALEQIF